MDPVLIICTLTLIGLLLVYTLYHLPGDMRQLIELTEKNRPTGNEKYETVRDLDTTFMFDRRGHLRLMTMMVGYRYFVHGVETDLMGMPVDALRHKIPTCPNTCPNTCTNTCPTPEEDHY